MMQAVVDPEERGDFGMHYTSVPNIMKVIEPLFLNELREEYEQSKYEPRKLNKLLDRISRIKIFDPACGSGNFLIIAYKELRKLEIDILKQLQELSKIASGFEPAQMELIPKAQLTLAASYKPTMFTNVKLTQFYGIELKDFAHELAILALWLAEHQMNLLFKEVFGAANPTLPLNDAGNITLGNATRLDWEQVCPKGQDDEIYILGNPPYLGGKYQSKAQKSDMAFVFSNEEDFGLLDYVTCWFYKGVHFLNDKSSLGFVSTSSICEGSQIIPLWPKLLFDRIKIHFAHQAFHWKNNAKAKAGVTCVIVGLSKKDNVKRFIYLKDGHTLLCNSITPYLVSGNVIYVTPRHNPISNLPSIITGNNPYEGGNLLLNKIEKDELIKANSLCERFVRRVIGSKEFINDIERWCVWITDENLDEALTIPELKERVENTRKWREKGGEVARGLVSKSHKFRFTNTATSSQILIPMTSSGRRKYFPIGYLIH